MDWLNQALYLPMVIKIGIVRDLQYDHQHPGHVIVGIEVDQDLRIPTGSKS